MKELSNVQVIERQSEILGAAETDADFHAAWVELDRWTAEDEAFMELAAKQEAIKRGEVAIRSANDGVQQFEAIDDSQELRDRTGPGLGAYATAAAVGAYGWLGNLAQKRAAKRAAHMERYAAQDSDSKFESIYKSFQRGRSKLFGAAALGAVLAVETGLLYAHIKGVGADRPLKNYNVHALAHTTNYEFGGRLDPYATGVIDAKRTNGQLSTGVNYIGVNYPATIAPLDNGPSLDVATDIGADAAFQDYLAKSSSGQQFYAEGFSEGSIAALKFAQRVQEHNGGVMPDNFHLVLEGSPVTTTGFFQSATAQNPALKPLLQAVGIDPDTGSLPPGTIARYSQNDVWANGANQSLLGQGVMVLDMNNSHVIQNPNNPHVVWIDRDGVRHEEYDVGVHPFTQIITNNNGVPVNSGFNDFFNDIIPINSNVNGAELARPNANAAINDLARGIDMETGGSGIPQQILAATPDSFRRVIQDGLDLANTAPDRILQDPSQIGDVMNDVSNMVGDVFKAMPSNTNAPVKDFITGAITNAAPPEVAAPVNQVVGQVMDSIREAVVVPTPQNPVIPQIPPTGNGNLDNVISQGSRIFNNTMNQIQQALPPAPAPVAAPAPVIDLPPATNPQVDQMINQGVKVANDILGTLFAPPAR